MKIGFSGRFFANNWRPALTEIAFAQRHGFQCLQWLLWEEPLTEERLGATWEQVRRALANAGITPLLEVNVQIATPDGLTSDGQNCLQVLYAHLPMIQRLEIPHVHWHLVLGQKMPFLTIEQLQKNLIPYLQAGVELAQKQGFLLGLEHNAGNMDFLATPESCATILNAIPHLRFIWDWNHTLPEHYQQFLHFLPRMSLLHISDTPLPQVNAHFPLGQGNIDLAGYAQAVKGFAQFAVLEIGGVPASGGFGRDSDQALIHSQQLLQTAFQQNGQTPHYAPT